MWKRAMTHEIWQMGTLQKDVSFFETSQNFSFTFYSESKLCFSRKNSCTQYSDLKMPHMSEKKINTALCRFLSSSAFAPALCTLLKELVNPRLILAYDLLSAAVVHFTSINMFFSNLSSLCLLSVFRSLLYVLSQMGIL